AELAEGARLLSECRGLNLYLGFESRSLRHIHFCFSWVLCGTSLSLCGTSLSTQIILFPDYVIELFKDVVPFLACQPFRTIAGASPA
ncbi:MAG: hypothetical protein JXD19_11220, partial [Deltaproteobacteria bacterium]|nr:hypothetical protein [Deltaproteobacteria bacterium]